MCLYCDRKEPYIAEGDIVCFKHLNLMRDGNKLITPYTHKKVCRKKNIIGHVHRPGLFQKANPEKKNLVFLTIVLLKKVLFMHIPI